MGIGKAPSIGAADTDVTPVKNKNFFQIFQQCEFETPCIIIHPSTYQSIIIWFISEDAIHGITTRLEKIIIDLHAWQDFVNARNLQSKDYIDTFYELPKRSIHYTAHCSKGRTHKIFENLIFWPKGIPLYLKWSKKVMKVPFGRFKVKKLYPFWTQLLNFFSSFTYFTT